MPRYLQTKTLGKEDIIVNLDLVKFFESGGYGDYTKLWFLENSSCIGIQITFEKMVEILQLNNSA